MHEVAQEPASSGRTYVSSVLANGMPLGAAPVMTVTFENAPLVELMVELRWASGLVNVTPAPTPGQFISINPARLEDFFERLSGELYRLGYQRAERLIPLGIPPAPFQPTYRYRRTTDEGLTVIYQAGPGYFSATALPRYRSWQDFAPAVRSGIEALFAARVGTESEEPFISATLRYINLFGADLTEGEASYLFLRRVFGISLGLPEPIKDQIVSEDGIKLHIGLAIPAKNGTSISITIADGAANNKQGLLFDMAVGTRDAVPAKIDLIMDTLTESRNTLHNIFIGLTKPIENLLRPRES